MAVLRISLITSPLTISTSSLKTLKPTHVKRSCRWDVNLSRVSGPLKLRKTSYFLEVLLVDASPEFLFLFLTVLCLSEFPQLAEHIYPLDLHSQSIHIRKGFDTRSFIVVVHLQLTKAVIYRLIVTRVKKKGNCGQNGQEDDKYSLMTPCTC